MVLQKKIWQKRKGTMSTTIDRIVKLKKIGPFKNFDAGGGVELSDVNLFYGYNGTGKTSLTRVLQCLNNGENVIKDAEGETVVDFTEAEISIKCNSNINGITSFGDSPIKNKIKVFNTDFIDNNLQLNKGKARKLFAILGEHNIATKTEIAKLEQNRDTYFNEKKQLKAQVDFDKASDEADSMKRNIATSIRTYLHIDNAQQYTIAHFKSDFSNYKDGQIITQKEADEAAHIYIAKPRPEIDQKYCDELDKACQILSLDKYKQIFLLLKTPIQRKTAQIKESVLQWLEQGMVLHDNEHDKCKFCGQVISKGFWEKRTETIKNLIKKDDVFEKQDEQLKSYFNEIKENIEFINSLSTKLPEASFLTRDTYQAYDQERQIFDGLIEEFVQLLQELLTNISEKTVNKDTIQIFEKEAELIASIIPLRDAAVNVKKAIEANNTLVKQAEFIKQRSKNIVVQFYIQENKKEIDKANKRVEDANTALITAKACLEKLDADIGMKRASLENQEENIKCINKLLCQLLDIGLEFTIKPGLDEYQLVRKIKDGPSIPARNLSEGEKNIIAFLYFLVSLESSSLQDKKNEIIVIDDPVSSLDSNNLFAVQNLVVSVLKGYGQKLFLTHNFYFFAKVRDSIRADIKANNMEPNDKMYMFELKKNAVDGSRIEKAGKYVKKHLSEYMSIIENLKDVLQRDTDEKDVTIGNLIRRALEVFLGFKDTDNDHDLFYKLKKRAGDNIKYQSILNMCNAFSHSEIGENADFSYMAGKEEVRTLFNFIKENDPDHFKGFGIRLNDAEEIPQNL